MSRGYFGIGIVGCKTGVNVGTLWRSAYNFGASFLVMIAPRYHKAHRHAIRRQASDTVDTYHKMLFFVYDTFEQFLTVRPYDCRIIAVEQTPTAHALETFVHPCTALYLLGAEDTGVPPSVLESCDATLCIDTRQCLNVAVAGSIVMYDRTMKQTIQTKSVAATPLSCVRAVS